MHVPDADWCIEQEHINKRSVIKLILNFILPSAMVVATFLNCQEVQFHNHIIVQCALHKSWKQEVDDIFSINSTL